VGTVRVCGPWRSTRWDTSLLPSGLRGFSMILFVTPLGSPQHKGRAAVGPAVPLSDIVLDTNILGHAANPADQAHFNEASTFLEDLVNAQDTVVCIDPEPISRCQSKHESDIR
jgi:hypothetical protein